MSKTNYADYLKQTLTDVIKKSYPLFANEVIEIEADKLKDVCSILKKECGFDMLLDISALDWKTHPKENQFPSRFELEKRRLFVCRIHSRPCSRKDCPQSKNARRPRSQGCGNIPGYRSQSKKLFQRVTEVIFPPHNPLAFISRQAVVSVRMESSFQGRN